MSEVSGELIDLQTKICSRAPPSFQVPLPALSLLPHHPQMADMPFELAIRARIPFAQNLASSASAAVSATAENVFEGASS